MSQSDSSKPVEDSHVYHLSDLKSVEEFCLTRAAILLSIVHPLSSRCQRFFPIYEELAASLSTSESEIECAQVDQAGDVRFMSMFGVRNFPTVVLCNGPQAYKTYRGPLRKDDILAFLGRQNMQTITDIISSASLDNIRAAQNTVVVAYFGQDDRAVRQHFLAVAEDMKDDFVFCTSSEISVAAQQGVSMPSVVVYKDVAEEKSVLVMPASCEAIRNFVHTATQPLITEFLPELHESMLEQSPPLGYIFVSSPSQQQQTHTDFLPLARKYKGRVRIGTVNVREFPDLEKEMHLTPTGQWPTFAIHEPARNKKYPLINSQAHLGSDAVDDFIGDFLAGNLKHTIKSQPVPSVQAGPVIEIVGLTYDNLVLDPKKDVLVEFYTQWCGPCKAMLPAYENLASLYISNPKVRDLVTIAKLDYEENDVPDKDIRGFPWVKLYPAGGKESPVTYGGPYRVASWAKFIAENGTHAVDLDIGAS